jgi:hypothetical protein
LSQLSYVLLLSLSALLVDGVFVLCPPLTLAFIDLNAIFKAALPLKLIDSFLIFSAILALALAVLRRILCSIRLASLCVTLTTAPLS